MVLMLMVKEEIIKILQAIKEEIKKIIKQKSKEFSVLMQLGSRKNEEIKDEILKNTIYL